MNLLSNIDFTDFYFNGHFLSDFGGFIGGLEYFEQLSLLPSRSYNTDRAIGQDGETVFSSHLDPRPFEIPIFFKKLDDAGLRNIAGWLNTKSPEWFHYKNDTLKIKCTLDTNGTYLDSITLKEGACKLKFIAHDPFYYEINETVHNYPSLTGTTHRFNLQNKGNEDSFPCISMWGSGTVKINIYKNTLSNLYTSCEIINLTSGVELDTKKRTCLTQSGGQMFNNFIGKFPVLPVGNYIFEVIGNVTRINIKPNFRFV